MAILLLSFPRLAVNLVLCVIGCQYLAQTPKLSDVMLNAVALAFVMDVDELLFKVITTDHIKAMTRMLRPMKGSIRQRQLAGIPLKEWVRYVIMLSLIVFSICYWLLPFNDAIEAAAMALCGGQHSFTFSGGTVKDPTVKLHPVGTYKEGCSWESYVAEYYEVTGSKSNKPPRDETDYGALIEKTVLNFALRGCPDGFILRPLRSDKSRTTCVEMPPVLLRSLPDGVTPGTADLAECTRFNPSLAASACTRPEAPEACLWDWTSKGCEDEFNVYENACDGGSGTQCYTWETFLASRHPTKNCMVYHNCEDYKQSCLDMDGELRITVDDAAVVMNEQKTAKLGIRRAIAAVGKLSIGLVHVNLTLTSSLIIVNYSISSIPIDFLPRQLVLSGTETTTQANAALSALGANFTALSIEFAPYKIYKDNLTITEMALL
mmetsp:Transcript_10519/g.27860  ORF Transcript_10519/g.27860 Transcript_10519/m.27860 type:complete len:434 (-) Transcript_10519:127-1428(-)